MTIDSVDAGKRGKDRSRNMGDPSTGDAEADAENDIAAGRQVGEAHRLALEGKHGKGVHPIEGTSASNIDPPAGRGVGQRGRTCGSRWVDGYGQCGGTISEETGRCTRCGIPTTREIQEAMAIVRIDDGILAKDPHSDEGMGALRIRATAEPGSADVMRAHQKEAARMILRREITAKVFIERNWDPYATGDRSALSTTEKRQMAAIQSEIDARVLVAFRLAGLEPRNAA